MNRPAAIFCLLIVCMTGVAARAASEDADAAFAHAMTIYFMGASIPGMQELEKNISENPNHSLSYSGLAFMEAMGLIDPLYSGTPERTRELIRTALEKGPDNEWNHLAEAMLAAAKYMRGDMAAILTVEKESRRALKVDPGAGEPHLLLWFVEKFIRGDREAAARHYDETVKLGMKYANAHYIFFFAESFFGDCAAAVPEAVTAVKEYPEPKSAYLEFGMPDVGGAEEIAPAACLMWKSMKLEKTGSPAAEREALFREALRTAPGFYYAGDKLAELLAGQGRVAEAEQLLESNYAAHPGSAGAALALASFYSGRAEYAEKLNKLLDSFPPFANTHYIDMYKNRLGDICKAAGRESVFRLVAGDAAGAREIADSLFKRFALESDDIQNLVTGSYGSLQLARLCADKIGIFTTAYKGVQAWLRERLAEKVEFSNHCEGGEETAFEWDRDTAFVPVFCDFVTAVYMEKEEAFGPDTGTEAADAKSRFGKIVVPVPGGAGAAGPGLRVRAYSDKELVWRFSNKDGAQLYRVEYTASGCN